MEKITELLENLDIAKYLPDIDKMMDLINKLIGLSVRIGPWCILGLGLIYLLIPPKEANRKAGFRTYFGMGSIAAWLFTQRVAGAIMTVAGLILNFSAKGVAEKMLQMGQMDMLKAVFECCKTQIICFLAIEVFMFVLTMLLFNRKGILRFKFLRNSFLGKLIPSEEKYKRPKQVKEPTPKKEKQPKRIKNAKAKPLPQPEPEPEEPQYERQGEQVITADDIVIEGLD